MEKYNIKRDGVEIASDVEEKTYTDTGLEPGTEYNYTVEISGVEDSETTVTTETTGSGNVLADPNIFVSNKELVWNDLPAKDQPDNGSLRLVSTEVKDNVPRFNGSTVVYETATVYTYEADFEWDNSFEKDLKWLVDVLAFKNNQLRQGFRAFRYMPATQLTALPDLDTSNLISMDSMFIFARAFKQPLNFDTSNVLYMNSMFYYASAFDLNISHWCVEKISRPPDHFDYKSGFEGIANAAKKPRWGQAC